MAEELPPGDPFMTDDEIGAKVDGTEWTQCTQQGTGRLYYYNFATEQSSWSLPQETELATLSVECPEGCGPGDLLSVEVDGALVEVQVPDGIGPGDAFEVQLQPPGDTDHADPGEGWEGDGLETGDDEPIVTRKFKLLVLVNAHVSTQKTLRVEASTIDELCEKVGKAVGVEDAIVCSPSDHALDEMMYTALDQIDDKHRVMVWPATAFADTLDVPEPAVQRDFILMVQANEHVQTNRKLKLTAGTLEELCGLIKESLQLRADLTLSRPTAAPQEEDCFSSISEVESKAKVMVWPAATLRNLFAAATVEQREAEAAEAAIVQAQADAAQAAEEEALRSARELSDEPPGDPFAADDEIGDQIDGTKWAECTQASTGRVYYFNFDTEESSWDVPDLDNEGDQVLEKQARAETAQLEPEPEESQTKDDDEDSADEDADEQEPRWGMGDENDCDGYNDQPARAAREALARHSRAPHTSASSPGYRRSSERTPHSRHRRERSSGGGSPSSSSSSRRRRSRSTRQDTNGGKRTATPSEPKSPPRSPVVINRGPDFDSSCHPLSRPPEYDPSRDKYMPPEYRKRIAEKRREIERAQALEHEMAVRQRYKRWSMAGYDEDDFSDDDYSHSEYSSDDSSGQDEDYERAQESDEREARRGGGSDARKNKGREARSRSNEMEQIRSPRGKPIPGSVALQHRVNIRPSDCDMFGELSAGSGVQFCADAMDVWILRSAKKAGTPAGRVVRSELAWRAVVNRADTHWVRRVRSGDEVVMTVEVCRWRRDGSFDMTFEARVDGEDVFRTDCRFQGLLPGTSGVGWKSAPPPEAFKNLWSE